MKVKHIFGDHIYLISSYSVPRNPLYRSNNDVDIFKRLVQHYLSDLCDIFSYSHRQNQFHYLIKIKKREELEEFFSKKQMTKQKNVSHNIYDPKAVTAPDSYLIFSQEVSNLLNSYVKGFNYKYNRHGSLTAGRYRKELITSEEEMNTIIDLLNNMEETYSFSSDWALDEEDHLSDDEGRCCSKIYYDKEQLLEEGSFDLEKIAMNAEVVTDELRKEREKKEDIVRKDDEGSDLLDTEGGKRLEGEMAGKCVFENFLVYVRGCLKSYWICLPPVSIHDPNYAHLEKMYHEKFGKPPSW